MSRAVAPATAQPNSPSQASQFKIPQDKIAMRAYEKWLKRGRPVGSPEIDWYAAEAELRAEMTKGQLQPPSQLRR